MEGLAERHGIRASGRWDRTATLRSWRSFLPSPSSSAPLRLCVYILFHRPRGKEIETQRRRDAEGESLGSWILMPFALAGAGAPGAAGRGHVFGTTWRRSWCPRRVGLVRRMIVCRIVVLRSVVVLRSGESPAPGLPGLPLRLCASALFPFPDRPSLGSVASEPCRRPESPGRARRPPLPKKQPGWQKTRRLYLFSPFFLCAPAES